MKVHKTRTIRPLLEHSPVCERSQVLGPGSMNRQAAASSGGRIASPVDLAGLGLVIDDQPSPPYILQSETIRLMTTRSELPDWQNSDPDLFAQYRAELP